MVIPPLQKLSHQRYGPFRSSGYRFEDTHFPYNDDSAAFKALFYLMYFVCVAHLERILVTLF